MADSSTPSGKTAIAPAAVAAPQSPASGQSKPGTAPAAPAGFHDTLLAGLIPAVEAITSLEPVAAGQGAAASLSGLLASLMAPPSSPVPTDTCASPAPNIAQSCNQRALDGAKTKAAYSAAASAATAAWQTELAHWTQVRAQYDFDMASAMVTLKAAAQDAVTAFNAKNNPDSASRSNFLYFTMQETIAAAIQTFAASAASAGSTLAGEASAIVGAYATYLGALNIAQAAQMTSQATADQTFWQTIEQIRDAT